MFEGKVQGAEIKNYLLEKSRVIGCTEKERNFHIFFFMMRGAGEELAKQLGFLKLDGSRKDFQDFKYLLKCNDLKREDDIESY
jgi:myosin heavy subunit